MVLSVENSVGGRALSWNIEVNELSLIVLKKKANIARVSSNINILA